MCSSDLRECCLDQTHGKSYRRKSELYAIPPRFSLHEQQLSEFRAIFFVTSGPSISLVCSRQVRSGFVCAFGRIGAPPRSTGRRLLRLTLPRARCAPPKRKTSGKTAQNLPECRIEQDAPPAERLSCGPFQFSCRGSRCGAVWHME